MTNEHPFIPFTQSAASQQVPPPYHFPNVTVNAFYWEADMLPIQRYCDHFFNLGSAAERGFVYKPAAFWPYISLLFIEYPEMISTAAPQNFGEVPYSDRGTVSQTEVFLAMPVMRYGTTPTKLITDSELECTLPFIVVGNPMSAVCGREMLGLGKLVAEIPIGEGEFPGSFKGGVKLPGWKSQQSGVQMEMLPFVNVKTGPTLPTFRMTGGPEKSFATLFQSRTESKIAGGIQTLANFVDIASIGLLPTAMRTVGLLQYRDGLNPDQAYYQALVTCRSRYSNVNNFELYDEQDVSITFQDTGSFHQALKDFMDVDPAPSNQTISVKPVAAFKFNADIDYDETRLSYRFPIERSDGSPNIAAHRDLTSQRFRPWKGFFGSARRP